MASHLTVKAKVLKRSKALPSVSPPWLHYDHLTPSPRLSGLAGSPTSKLTLPWKHISGQEEAALTAWSLLPLQPVGSLSILFQPQWVSLLLTRGQAPLPSGCLPEVVFPLRSSNFLCLLVLTQVFLSQ